MRQTAFVQALRQHRGSAVQRRVVVLARAVAHGRVPRRAARVGDEAIDHRREGRRGQRQRGVGEQGTCRRGQQGHLAQGHRRLRDHLLQQAAQLLQQVAHRRSRQSVGAVHRGQADGSGRRLNVQRQRELGAGCRDDRLAREPTQIQRRGQATERVDQHVEERRVVSVARGRQFGHEAVERHVLVRPGVQRGGAHAAQQLGKAGVAAEVGAQHQCVEQQPDHRLQFGPVAASHRRAHRHVLLAEAAHEQQLEARQQGHEDGGVVVACECLDAPHQVGGQGQGLQRAGVVRRRGFGGQAQRFQAVELLAPVGERRVQGARLGARALPERHVAPLQWQRRQNRRALRRCGLALGVVQRIDFGQQHLERPAVADEVVQHQHHDVLLIAQPHEPGACERRLRQVERAVGKVVQQRLQGGLRILFMGRRQGQVLQGPARFGLQRQCRHATMFGHAHLQDVVARAEPLQAALQRRPVQRAAQAGGLDDVVVGGGRGGRCSDRSGCLGGSPCRACVMALQALHQPQPLLSGRHRHAGIAARAGAGGRVRRRLRDGGAPGSGVLRGNPCGQLRHRRRVEQRAQRNLDIQAVAQARDDLHRQQRVAAELKEVVVHAELRHLQQRAPDIPDRLLHRGARCGRLGACLLGSPLRHRQRLAVDLAVGQGRQPRQRHERRWHQRLGQLALQPAPQCVGVEGTAWVQHHVGDQALQAGLVFARQHDAVLHAFLRVQRRFDLAEFDADASDLDLEVGTAQVFEPPVAQPAHLVAGAVDALAGLERVRHKPVCGQLGLVQVAARQAGPADAELAHHAHRHRLAVGVEHITLRVGDRPTDGDGGRATEVLGHHLAVRGVVGGLAGAVEVAQCRVREPAPERCRQVQPHGLAAAHHVAQMNAGLQAGLVQQQPQQRGHEHDGGDAFVAQRAHQAVRVAVLARRRQHDGGAAHQRHEEVGDGRVEGDGRHLQHAVAARHVQRLREPQFVVRQRAVRDHDALGAAGGAGGVDHIGQVIGPCEAGRVAVVRGPLLPGSFALSFALSFAQQRIQAQHVACLARRRLRHALLQVRLRQHHLCGGVGQHVCQALGGQLGVERHEGAAGLEHGQQAHHQLDAALHANAHRPVGADAEPAQVVSEPVGLHVELGIAQVPAAERGGDRQRRAPRLSLDQRVRTQLQRVGLGGVVPLGEHEVALGVVQQPQARHRLRGVGAHGVHHRMQPAGQALDGGGVEQVGVVLQPTFELVAGLLQFEAQVEPRDRAAGEQPASPHRAERAVERGRRLQHQERLDERLAAQVGRQLQRVHHLVEWNVLVLVGRKRRGLDLAQQRFDGEPVAEVAAQRQQVGKRTHHAGAFVPIAVGDDGAGDHRRLPRVAVQQRLPGRQQGHEERGVGAAGEGLQPTQWGRTDAQFERRAAMALAARAAVVGGQRQRAGCVVKLALPVRQFARTHATLQRARFPGDEVQVLQVQPRQRRRQALRPRLVDQAQLVHQHAHRPTVAHAVVQGPQQSVLLRRQRDQRGPEGGFTGEVETLGRLARGQLVAPLARQRRVRAVEPHLLQAPVVQRLDALVGLVALHQPARSQHLVALDQHLQAGLQGGCVQRTRQLHHHRHVVDGRARRQLVHDPHAPLGGRQRERAAAQLRRQRCNRCRQRHGLRRQAVEPLRHRPQVRLAQQAGRWQRTAQRGLQHLQQPKARQRVQPVFDGRRVERDLLRRAAREARDALQQQLLQRCQPLGGAALGAQVGRQVVGCPRRGVDLGERVLRLRDVHLQHLQAAFQVVLPAALATDLAAGGARHAARAHQRDRMHRQFVLRRHRLADGADHRHQVHLVAAPLHLLHDDECFAVGGIDRERRAITRPQ